MILKHTNFLKLSKDKNDLKQYKFQKWNKDKNISLQQTQTLDIAAWRIHKQGLQNASLYMSSFKGNLYTFRGDNVVKINFPSVCKYVYFKTKECTPHESKFFLFKVDHFAGKQTESQKKVVTLTKNAVKTYLVNVEPWACRNSKCWIT